MRGDSAATLAAFLSWIAGKRSPLSYSASDSAGKLASDSPRASAAGIGRKLAALASDSAATLAAFLSWIAATLAAGIGAAAFLSWIAASDSPRASSRATPRASGAIGRGDSAASLAATLAAGIGRKLASDRAATLAACGELGAGIGRGDAGRFPILDCE